jgi:hypothetical protein
VHYVAFDLWAGRWVAEDGAARGIPRLLVAPCLLLTVVVGPAGLLGYWALARPWYSKPRPQPRRKAA